MIILFILHLSLFDSLLHEGIYYSYQEDYEKAESLFVQAKCLNPTHPAPYFLQAALYGLYLADHSTTSIEEKFFIYADSAIKLAQKKVKDKDTSAMIRLWLAGGYGARAFYKVWRKNIISGIRDGIRGIREFTRVLEMDSTIYDAYIGVAGYDFFKHRYLSFLPWVEDKKWEWEIKLAATKGRFFKIAARAGHALLLMEDGRYKEGIETITPLIKEFPTTKTFKWIRLRGYYGLAMWEEAYREFTELLNLILLKQKDNYYNIGLCKTELAKISLKLNQKTLAKKYCTEVLALPLDKDERIKKLKEEVNSLLKFIE